MNKKEKRLVEILLKKDDSTTSQQLALEMNVSERSVRNYIQHINEQRKCITSSNKGYIIEKSSGRSLLEEGKTEPENKKERVTYLIYEILKTSNENSLDLYDVADQLAVSIETINKDFAQAKKKLLEYNLYVTVHESFVNLDGLESDKRRLLSSLISEEYNENFLNVHSLQILFPQYDIQALLDIVKESCKQYHYYINEYALMNLLLELTISIDRIKNDFSNTKQNVDYKSLYEFREMQLSRKISLQIEEKFSVSFNQIEYEEFTNILIGYLMKIDYSKIKVDDLQKYLGPDCYQLVQNLKNYMRDWKVFDVDSSDFTIKFSLHIKNLMARLKNHVAAKNSLTVHIRNNCPMIFEYAVRLADAIHRYTGFKINDDEISFLALHIGSIMGETNNLSDKVSCVLYFPQYYDYSIRIVDTLKKEFSGRIMIQEIVEKYEDLEFQNNDLIITTMTLHDSGKAKSVVVTPFVTQRDLNAISTALDEIETSREITKLRSDLEKIVSNETFYKNMGFANFDQIIQFACTKMYENGYVHDNYDKDILERESESSTAYGKVAVPHSFHMNAKKTGMFVYLTDKAVKWGENEVNIVLLFAVSSSERSIFFHVFDNLVSQLLEITNLNKVVSSNSVDEFVQNIISCYKN